MQLSEADQNFIKKTRERNGTVVAVTHPDWRGIRRSIEQHCSAVYYVADDVTETSAVFYADLLAESGAKKIVYGALPLSYAHLIRTIHQRHPSIEQFITWHGSFLQSNEDYNWESFKGALCLCREGSVKRIGFVKKGMEVLTRKLDVDAVFYSNFIDKIPQAASTPEPGGPHLGVWAIAPIWRKKPVCDARSFGIDSGCLSTHSRTSGGTIEGIYRALRYQGGSKYGTA